MKPFKMALPGTVQAATELCQEKTFKDVKLLAGGTDLVAELKERIQTPELVVNLKSIPGLNGVKRTDRGLEIGALVTIAELAAHPDVKAGYPALAWSAQCTATPQIRNVGTVGGNLCQRPRCWYYRDETYNCLKKGGEKCYTREGENEYHAIFDNATCNIIHPSNLAPVLIAYGAQIEITGPKTSEVLPAEEFFVSPEEDISRENILAADQVLLNVILPPGSENRNAAYFEAREKATYDWALCGATVALRFDGKKVREARIVLSAVAPRPVRRTDLEEMLQGQTIGEELIKKIGDAAIVDATPLRDNKYKLILVKAAIARAIREAAKA